MTRLPAPTPPCGRSRRRHPVPRMVVALAVVCGVGLAVSPAPADTVLRGKVTFQPMASAGLPGARETAPSYSDLVIYVTEKPGERPLAGRPKRMDVKLTGDQFEPRVLAINVG